jgi:electron transport complex protein RnfC
MTVAAAPFGNVHVRPVPARYPMGSDKQLIQTLTGKEVPADARAAEVGVLVHNVSTCAAVHRALRRGEPLVERIVTVNGGALTGPGNIMAPLGTLVADLLRFAGVNGEPARLVLGGPMMGIVLPHARVPIVKGASGILAFDAGEARHSRGRPLHPLRQLHARLARWACCRSKWRAASAPATSTRRPLRPLRLHRLRLLCLRLSLAHPAGAVLQLRQGRTLGARAQPPAQRCDARLADERQARLAREAREKVAAAARRKAERDAAKAAATARPAPVAVAVAPGEAAR